MKLIQTITVGADGAASIEFTGIPQDATDLLLLVSGRISDSGTSYFSVLQVNELTSDIYTRKQLLGTGSQVFSGTGISTALWIGHWNANGSTANTFDNFSIYIPNYTSSVKKSVSADTVVENNQTAVRQYLTAGEINTTSAINSIKLFDLGGTNLLQHSTASLYSITKA